MWKHSWKIVRSPFACRVVFQSMWKSPNHCWNFMESGSETTCLFTRLEESSLVPAGFLTAQFLQKKICMKTCFDGRTKVKFLCIAAMKKNKSGDKPIFHLISFMILPLSFREALNRSTTLFPRSKQRLPKLRFLQKLGCQKPCWDQARLCLAW